MILVVEHACPDPVEAGEREGCPLTKPFLLSQSEADHRNTKRSAGHRDVEITAGANYGRLLEVNELLDRLAEENSTKAEVAKLKFFVGLSNAETALAV